MRSDSRGALSVAGLRQLPLEYFPVWCKVKSGNRLIQEVVMAIQSVTSNVSAYTATPSSQASQAQQAQQMQQAEERQSRAEEKAAQQEVAPQPVTNVQGQRTGTLINVTA
jgi:uncharacterized membrane protein